MTDVLIDIRPATPDDVPLVLDFVRALAEYEEMADEVVATEQGFAELMFGEHALLECLLAHVDGEPAGFALYFHNVSSFTGRRGLYLEDLFVKPEHRGLGLGKRLLVHLAKLAVERNCARFEWTVLDWNTPAIEFYESLGSKPMNGWTVHRVAGEALERLAEGG